MPIYSFRCRQCGRMVEQVLKYADRDKPSAHEDCGGALEREGVELFRSGKEGYQVKAVMADGSHVAGHFGKEASRRRKQ